MGGERKRSSEWRLLGRLALTCRSKHWLVLIGLTKLSHIVQIGHSCLIWKCESNLGTAVAWVALGTKPWRLWSLRGISSRNLSVRTLAYLSDLGCRRLRNISKFVFSIQNLDALDWSVSWQNVFVGGRLSCGYIGCLAKFLRLSNWITDVTYRRSPDLLGAVQDYLWSGSLQFRKLHSCFLLLTFIFKSV